ncbi:MAG: TIGR04283 family arsenosugar biosynthesis glycosyltransferase [Gammaproteobacteria bacterium]|nr:TIGR04283 family arsenosugar biosynthesis glycosyltransferase [Gammaproteobacteria bacterium]MBA3731073.1 TIGR04283 family arsenosugar biosynthesis glycosyltransferase [Gammaproteobacteria bacterium]
MRLSVIIPALNEADGINQTLQTLQALRTWGHEVIVVDGGSQDDTLKVCGPFVDRLLRSPRGRACQMNAGAAVASGDVFVFLHADTLLPRSADRAIRSALHKGRRWGRFDVKLSGRRWLLRVVERGMNLRSRVTGICTGDQAIFVRRQAFEKIGGFQNIELMEDIALSRALLRLSRPARIKWKVKTSSRRWESEGITRTIGIMWLLRLSYFFGADPARLARRYGARTPAG